MSIRFELVDGRCFAESGSRLLRASWARPVVDYSASYLNWQLTFPSEVDMPAVAALDATELVGFAATSTRRIRFRAALFSVLIVSFVGVHPLYRNRGVGGGLYDVLLRSIRNQGATVMTFGIPDSAGERTLLRAYSAAGFEVHELDTHFNYGAVASRLAPNPEWVAEIADESTQILAELASECADRSPAIWSDPDEKQLLHYEKDPRRRTLITVKCSSGAIRGAAYLVEAPIQTPTGLTSVPTLDAVWLPAMEVGALVALFHRAAVHANAALRGINISAPNLSGFSRELLRSAAIRQTGTAFRSYLCTTQNRADYPNAAGTNLEIV
jgi:GNAT superfamily N-acetyltransferase